MLKVEALERPSLHVLTLQRLYEQHHPNVVRAQASSAGLKRPLLKR
jgi:hypothetical protein